MDPKFKKHSTFWTWPVYQLLRVLLTSSPAESSSGSHNDEYEFSVWRVRLVYFWMRWLVSSPWSWSSFHMKTWTSSITTWHLQQWICLLCKPYFVFSISVVSLNEYIQQNHLSVTSSISSKIWSIHHMRSHNFIPVLYKYLSANNSCQLLLWYVTQHVIIIIIKWREQLHDRDPVKVVKGCISL